MRELYESNYILVQLDGCFVRISSGYLDLLGLSGMCVKPHNWSGTLVEYLNSDLGVLFVIQACG